jgi:ribosome-binding factor A
MRHTSYRNDKLPELLARLAAEFLSEQSNRTSLITITGSKLSGDGKLITLLYTVLPDNQEAAAQDFLDRQRKHFKEYVQEKSRLGRVPHISFKIDQGERNRQKIDLLLGSD